MKPSVGADRLGSTSFLITMVSLSNSKEILLRINTIRLENNVDTYLISKHTTHFLCLLHKLQNS